MKKFALKALTLAAASVCGSTAFAGSISTPATDAAATVYAAEALLNTTVLTSPVIVYTMGVPRTVDQDFTVIVTPSAGSSFVLGSCTTAAPVVAGLGAVATVSLKRASTSECAWEVDITTASIVGSTLTFTGLQFLTHTLGTAGNSASVTLALKDLGETAFIDNTGTLTRRVATAAQAINIYAATSDVATVADVNAATGPLTGFVANATVPADTATRAAANLTFDNNSIGARNAANTAAFDFLTTTGTASITLTGSTSGAATNGFCIDVDNDAVVCEAAERFTLTPTTATLAGIPSSAFPATGSTATRTVTFLADGTTQLGTSRTYALSGTITPQVGAAEAIVNTSTSANATAWVWSANASQLVTPYFTTSSLFLSRVFFLNTGALPVGYTATCYSETGNAITYGSAQTGTLSGNGQTAVNLKNVCSFANTGLTRGSVLFTINAPIGSIKGSYQQIDPVSLNNAIVPLSRPYGTSTTE